MALVDVGGTVVEFLSYEGVLTAAGGAGGRHPSIDIGLRELGYEPVGLSLARGANGTWTGPAANTFGACNDGDPSRRPR